MLFVLYHKIKAGGITYLYFLIFREEAKRCQELHSVFGDVAIAVAKFIEGFGKMMYAPSVG